MISCTKTMAKRMQEQKEDNRTVAKIKANGDELGQCCSCKFFICEQSDCVEKPGDTQGLKSTDWVFRETRRKIKAKFQSRRSVEFSRGEPVATDKDQESLNYPELICTGYPGNPGTAGNSEDSETEGRLWPHHFHVSPDCVPHMEKVLTIVRQTYGRSPTDDLKDLDVNTAIWGIFYVCHSSGCSSSWARLHGKSAIHQESTLEICETVISND